MITCGLVELYERVPCAQDLDLARTLLLDPYAQDSMFPDYPDPERLEMWDAPPADPPTPAQALAVVRRVLGGS